MFVVPRDLELSRRRAAAREAVLLYLSVVHIASVWEVSEATGIRPARVVGIMEGAPREYSRELSLCVQGAARVAAGRDARRYAITSLGLRSAGDVALRLGLA